MLPTMEHWLTLCFMHVLLLWISCLTVYPARSLVWDCNVKLSPCVNRAGHCSENSPRDLLLMTYHQMQLLCTLSCVLLSTVVILWVRTNTCFIEINAKAVVTDESVTSWPSSMCFKQNTVCWLLLTKPNGVIKLGENTSDTANLPLFATCVKRQLWTMSKPCSADTVTCAHMWVHMCTRLYSRTEGGPLIKNDYS